MAFGLLPKASKYVPRRHGYVGETFDDLYRACDWANMNGYFEILCYDKEGKYLYTLDVQGLLDDWAD